MTYTVRGPHWTLQAIIGIVLIGYTHWIDTWPAVLAGTVLGFLFLFSAGATMAATSLLPVIAEQGELLRLFGDQPEPPDEHDD